MSALRDRLRRLTKSESRRTLDEQRDQTARSGEVQGAGAVHADGYDAEQAAWKRIDAEIWRSEGGAFIRRTRRYVLDHRHGRCRLGELRQLDEHLAALSTAGKQPLHPQKVLFFDTETTGLGIGAGNVPFMLGYGFLDADAFVVEQLFIRGPAEEYDALAYFRKVLERFSYVVTYNGRAFDWSVLMNRFVLHRLPPPLAPAQIDLLYPARSLWKHELPSCRLSIVEEQRLGYHRGVDLPGSEAPVRYMQYLSTRQVSDVEEVFTHNERDILSLAALAVHFQRLLTQAVGELQVGAEEVVRLSAWLDKLGMRRRAQEVLAAGLSSERMGRRQLLDAAALYKRWHEHDKAAALWRLYIQRSAGMLHAWEPLIELAMHYEHRERDLEAALHCTLRARKLIERRLALGRGRRTDRELLQQIDHRLARLQRKLKRPKQEVIRFH